MQRTDIPSSSAAYLARPAHNAALVDRIEDLPEEAQLDLADALREVSLIRTGGYSLPVVLFVVLLVVGLAFGPPMNVIRMLMLVPICAMVGSLVAVPWLGRRHLRRLMSEKGIDPSLLKPILCRLQQSNANDS